MTNDQIVPLVMGVISRSPYVSMLHKLNNPIIIRVDEDVSFLFEFSWSGDVNIAIVEDLEAAPVLINVTSSDLQAAQAHNQDARIQIQKKVDMPGSEQLLIRCFQMPPYPVPDRDELIYPVLWGGENEVIWRGADLQVFYYKNSNTLVTSGLSNAAWEAPSNYFTDDVAGAGYELLLLHESEKLKEEFVSWVQYVQKTKNHILAGSWLELENGALIKGTDYAGFVVVDSLVDPGQFMMNDKPAYFHQMLPVNKVQLQEAKEMGAQHVAETYFLD